MINLQTFSQNLQKKVIRDRLSTNFDPRLEPVDVKNLKNLGLRYKCNKKK